MKWALLRKGKSVAFLCRDYQTKEGTVIRKLAITTNTAIFLLAFAFELLGIGLIAKYREGQMYDVISATGNALLFVSLYFVFCLVIPAVNLIALLIKDRGFLLEHFTR
jgi:hypothetical protein